MTGASGKWTDRGLFDASYVRLKNVTLGYTLPENLTRNIGLDRVRITLEGHNIWLHDNAPYVFNVEGLSYATGDPLASGGYNYTSYPLARQYMIGVDVSF